MLHQIYLKYEWIKIIFVIFIQVSYEISMNICTYIHEIVWCTLHYKNVSRLSSSFYTPLILFSQLDYDRYVWVYYTITTALACWAYAIHDAPVRSTITTQSPLFRKFWRIFLINYIPSQWYYSIINTTKIHAKHTLLNLLAINILCSVLYNNNNMC